MDDTKKINAADLIMACLMFISGCLLIVSSLKMKIFNNFLDAPGFFPFILGIVFILLGIMMFFSSLRRNALHEITIILKKSILIGFISNPKFHRVFILIIFMMVYIFGLIGRIHFAIASTLYLSVTMIYLKSTSVWKIIIISVVSSVLICIVFRYAFEIPLP